ncbi:acyl-CoA N-acyltransferase [Ceratobasidium sp. AG-I]|nr:acyl-CoA N-acyltransferase [Ceratobasidium sp. AG-I]
MTSTKIDSSWSIRPVTVNDQPSLSRICLLTGDAGQSAESQHHFAELLGLVYAEPYVVISPWFGFLLIHPKPDGSEEILGYILGTPDTRRFESGIERDWYPPIRLKYPTSPYPAEATDSDRSLIDRIHKPDTTPQEVIDVSKAHIHIDLLPQAQGYGWGTKLMSKAVGYLKEQGSDSVFVGIDPRNHKARKFYLAVGFESVATSEGEFYRLDLSGWKF